MLAPRRPALAGQHLPLLPLLLLALLLLLLAGLLLRAPLLLQAHTLLLLCLQLHGQRQVSVMRVAACTRNSSSSNGSGGSGRKAQHGDPLMAAVRIHANPAYREDHASVHADRAISPQAQGASSPAAAAAAAATAHSASCAAACRSCASCWEAWGWKGLKSPPTS